MASETLTESPHPHRFESHVAFDNIPLGESTDFNPIAFTLNYRHAGYALQRESRTFMVGVDDNAYSDHALQWLLDELVDDGDQIVCVRVIETTVRSSDKAYKDAAHVLMQSILSKNKQNRAISLVLEYAVGKLHNTFQHLIKIHQPSMLVVGTKGRSLDGVHGFLVNRNSFSKYCLQYSPVPVVVVRPTEKREKKKAKRAQDPSRHSYKYMLPGQKHEADSENSSLYELEPNITADEEAHRVAHAIGLPAKFDPTVKPIDPQALLARAASRRSVNLDTPTKEAVALAATGRVPAEQKGANDEESEEEEEEEFEVTTGDEALKKERLHTMEQSEGLALKEMRKMSRESIEEESDEEGVGDGGAKTKTR
ncbi:Usp domain-containing protein [Xylariales sp. AK1849]|nr:Usp domain-containing protein [Xylariales sp. AK1849]